MRSTVLTLLALLVGPVIAVEAGKRVDLLNGKDLSAWEFVTSPAADVASVCHYQPDGTLAVVGKPVGYLATRKSFDNYRFHAEWRWPAEAKTSNGGVLLHIASGPKDRQWPFCFQVQTKIGRAGDLLPMAGAIFAEKLSTPPDAKTPQLNRLSDAAERPPGEWNACDVLCRNGVIEVRINGVLQAKVSDANPGAGKVGFQLEGAPFELRNVSIEPLD